MCRGDSAAAADLITEASRHHVSVRNVSLVFCSFLEQLLAVCPGALVAVI